MIDVPRSAFTVRQKVIEAATKVVIVTELTLPGLRDTIRLLANVEDVAPKTPVIVVANRAGGASQAMPIAEFQKAIGRKIDFQLPEEPKALNNAANSGKPLLQQDKRGKLAKATEKVAKVVLETKDTGDSKTKKKKAGFGKIFKGK